MVLIIRDFNVNPGSVEQSLSRVLELLEVKLSN